MPGVARMGIEYDLYGVMHEGRFRTGWRLLTADDFDARTGHRVTQANGEPL